MYGEESVLGSLMTVKKKSKKEEMIDKKIEYLLETYKKHDQELIKKASQKSVKVKEDRKKIRDKFGFSDDEEEDEEIPEDDAASESKMAETQKSGNFTVSSKSGSQLPPVAKQHQHSTNKKIVF